MCEGTNEETLINLLLDKNKLKFSRSDLIGLKPYHARQLTHPVIITELKHYNGPTTILRIGDSQKDELKIPKDLQRIVLKKNVIKYCTRPEIEILFIINENVLKDYQKSKMQPSKYIKKHFHQKGINYTKSNEFFKEYYKKGLAEDVQDLINNLEKYKRLKKHSKDELYLVDLIK